MLANSVGDVLHHPGGLVVPGQLQVPLHLLRHHHHPAAAVPGAGRELLPGWKQEGIVKADREVLIGWVISIALHCIGEEEDGVEKVPQGGVQVAGARQEGEAPLLGQRRNPRSPDLTSYEQIILAGRPFSSMYGEQQLVQSHA